LPLSLNNYATESKISPNYLQWNLSQDVIREWLVSHATGPVHTRGHYRPPNWLLRRTLWTRKRRQSWKEPSMILSGIRLKLPPLRSDSKVLASKAGKDALN